MTDLTYCVQAVSHFIQYTLNEAAARCLDLSAFYLGSVYQLIIVLVNQLSGLSDRWRYTYLASTISTQRENIPVSLMSVKTINGTIL